MLVESISLTESRLKTIFVLNNNSICHEEELLTDLTEVSDAGGE